MNYITAAEVIQLHDWLIDLHGGSHGIIDHGLIDSAVYQPQATFAGHDLNPTLADKAAALGFSLVNNHAFADGNKRIAQAAMETFLVRNGFEIEASIDDQEDVFLAVASGSLDKKQFTDWVRAHMVPLVS